MLDISAIMQCLDEGSPLNADEPSVIACLDSHGDSPIDSFWGFANSYRNRHLLAGRMATMYRTDTPVYAIGSGPSLTPHLDWLRDNQGGIIIVCGHSTCEMLARHGIAADFVVATERVVQPDDITAARSMAAYPWVPVCHDSVLLYPNSSTMCRWLGISGPPQTLLSGMAAVALANEIAAGDLWLIGHDLCEVDGCHHAEGYAHGNYSAGDMAVTCMDGQVRQSTAVWSNGQRYASRLGLSAKTPCATAAAIDGVSLSADLTAGNKRIRYTEGSHTASMDAVCELWDRLPYDLMEYRDRGELPSSANARLIEYCMQPLFAAFSIERRLDRHPYVADWFASTVHDTITTMLIGIQEVRDAA